MVAFGIGWFFLALSVESSLIPIVDVIYEHRAYLPSVGPYAAAATLLGLAVLRVAPQGAERVIALAGLALALVLGSLTLQRNAVWATAVGLWTDTAAKSPAKFRPHLNLGESLDAARDLAGAERELRRAVEIDPRSVLARTSLATVLQKSGRLQEAESEYRAALRLAPDHPPAIFNLAALLWGTGRRDEAAALYRRFLEVAPAGGGPARSLAAARANAARPP